VSGHQLGAGGGAAGVQQEGQVARLAGAGRLRRASSAAGGSSRSFPRLGRSGCNSTTGMDSFAATVRAGELTPASRTSAFGAGLPVEIELVLPIAGIERRRAARRPRRRMPWPSLDVAQDDRDPIATADTHRVQVLDGAPRPDREARARSAASTRARRSRWPLPRRARAGARRSPGQPCFGREQTSATCALRRTSFDRTAICQRTVPDVPAGGHCRAAAGPARAAKGRRRALPIRRGRRGLSCADVCHPCGLRVSSFVLQRRFNAQAEPAVVREPVAKGRDGRLRAATLVPPREGLSLSAPPSRQRRCRSSPRPWSRRRKPRGSSRIIAPKAPTRAVRPGPAAPEQLGSTGNGIGFSVYLGM